MRKLLTTLIATLVLTASIAHAQVILPFTKAIPAVGLIGADDTDIALLIKYVGTDASAKVAVTSGDLIFTAGAAGATADTEVNSGALCGATAGTIDVDDADCNTVREVLDTINKTNSWRAVVVDGALEDLVSGAKLLDIAATTCSTEDGLTINWDSTAQLSFTRCLNCPRSIGPYLGGGHGFNARLVPNVLGGLQTILFYFEGYSTYNTTSRMRVISAKTTYSGPLNTSKETFVAGSSSLGAIYDVIAGATGTSKTAYNLAYGLLCAYDSRCLVRITNTSTSSAGFINAYGATFSYK